jgi:hypothetical protein
VRRDNFAPNQKKAIGSLSETSMFIPVFDMLNVINGALAAHMNEDHLDQRLQDSKLHTRYLESITLGSWDA